MHESEFTSEKCRLLYGGLPLALLFSAVVAILLAYLQREVLPTWQWALWLGLMCAVLIVRAFSYLLWRARYADEPKSHGRALVGFRVLSVSTGAVWGLTALLLFPSGNPIHQVVMAFALAGVSAGAIASTSVDRTTVLGFVSTMLFPPAIRLLIEGGEIATAMGTMGVLYLIYIASNALRIGAVLSENFALRRESMAHEYLHRESEARLNRAQQVAQVGSFDWDPVTGRLEWSDEHFRLWGIQPQVVQPSYELFHQGIHPDDAEIAEDAMTRALEGGGSYEVLFRVIGGDGRQRHVRSKGEAFFDGRGRAQRLIGTVQDVTERVRNEQAMVEAKQIAESASRAKSEFLASMSHELRTPLNAILGFSQLLTLDQALSEDTLAQVREIELAGKHLLTLVNDLIDLARIEAGKIDMTREQVPVRDLLDNSMAMIAPIARTQGIEVTLHDVGLEEGMSLLVDYNRMRQVLINLLSNGIKYNRKNGRVDVHCKVTAGQLRILVTDTGPGIPAAMQDRIFNAFDRLGAERGTVEGTGIGLVITRRIVEAMGGTIGFESVEGDGSTFWVEFPLTRPLEQQSHPMSGLATLESAARRSVQPAVLYIEDAPTHVRLMRQIFTQRKDLRLHDAHSAKIGIELAQAEPPVLILLAMDLPDEDGFEAMRQLQSDPRTADIPVVAVSSANSKVDEAHCREAGFEACLMQPIDIRELHKLLDRALARAGN